MGYTAEQFAKSAFIKTRKGRRSTRVSTILDKENKGAGWSNRNKSCKKTALASIDEDLLQITQSRQLRGMQKVAEVSARVALQRYGEEASQVLSDCQEDLLKLASLDPAQVNTYFDQAEYQARFQLAMLSKAAGVPIDELPPELLQNIKLANVMSTIAGGFERAGKGIWKGVKAMRPSAGKMRGAVKGVESQAAKGAVGEQALVPRSKAWGAASGGEMSTGTMNRFVAANPETNARLIPQKKVPTRVTASTNEGRVISTSPKAATSPGGHPHPKATNPPQKFEAGKATIEPPNAAAKGTTATTTNQAATVGTEAGGAANTAAPAATTEVTTAAGAAGKPTAPVSKLEAAQQTHPEASTIMNSQTAIDPSTLTSKLHDANIGEQWQIIKGRQNNVAAMINNQGTDVATRAALSKELTQLNQLEKTLSSGQSIAGGGAGGFGSWKPYVIPAALGAGALYAGGKAMGAAGQVMGGGGYRPAGY